MININIQNDTLIIETAQKDNNIHEIKKAYPDIESREFR